MATANVKDSDRAAAGSARLDLADNQGSFATGQIYGASGGAGPP
jgi:hypothetical protein